MSERGEAVANEGGVNIFEGVDETFVYAEENGDGAAAHARDDIDGSHGHSFKEESDF